MQITVDKKLFPTPLLFVRRVGYAAVADRTHGGVHSFVRRLSGGEFPRFHLYAEDAGDAWHLNLHLDQRAPVYAGSRAHGGEYDGATVEVEIARIKQLLAV